MLSGPLKNFFKLIFIGLVTFVVLGELFCRIIPQFRYEYFPDIYRPDKKLGWVLIPSSQAIDRKPCYSIRIKINSMGLRDREVALQKKKNTFRILVLGDSFTFGSGVENEETFPKYLERLLNVKSNEIKYEVINAGIFGWGTSQEYAYLKEGGIRFKPDLIILAFAPNDVEDVYYQEFKGWKLNLSPRFPFKNFVTRHSYFYRNMRMPYTKFLISLGKRGPSAFFDSPSQVFQETFPEKLKLAFDKTEEIILKMDILAKQNKAKVAFVFVPTTLEVLGQLNEDRYLRGKSYFFDTKFQANYQLRVRKEISEFLRKNGTFNLDPLSDFTYSCSAESLHNLYFWCDGHFTPEGHKLFAQAIYNFLLKNNMLK